MYFTFTTILFDKDLFGDAIALNLTIMLVMTTILTSKIEELPPTSDMKMIDTWLIFCLVVPFLEVILRTAIECKNCGCDICKGKVAIKNKVGEKDKGKEEKSAVRVLVRTGAKVAPQQVTICLLFQRRWESTFSRFWQRTKRKEAPQQQLNLTKRWKKTWRVQEEFTLKGPGGVSLHWQVKVCWKQKKRKEDFLETWALPITISVAAVAYAVLAAAFYKKDIYH